MGTSYHITFKAPKGVAVADIQASIDKRLSDINASMSTYDPNSTISKFNALNAHESIVVDDDFIHVLNDSREIYEKSAHAFDPTVYPLVKLWGFGGNTSIERLQNPPRDDEILQAKKIIGLDKVILDGNRLYKTVDGVGLDFSAIAKGYGTDKVAQTLKNTYKINDFMVEIGGEVATSGVNDKGKPWTLAIDKQDGFEYGFLVIRGELVINGQHFIQDELAVLSDCTHADDTLTLWADAGTHVMLLGGEPLAHKTLIWWNFVADNVDDLRRAVADWNAGHERFGTIDLDGTSLTRLTAPDVPDGLRA